MTPELIASIYTTLRQTRPFVKWPLPPAEDVKFLVTRSTEYMGAYRTYRGSHTLKVSSKRHTYLSSTITTVAHEMVHMTLAIKGEDWLSHGAKWRKLAARVCRDHGWDLACF